MTNQVAIFQNDEGGISIVGVAPSMNTPELIKAAVEAAVPEGKPYVMVDRDTVPTDRTFRNAWEIDAAELISGVGHTKNTVSEIVGG